MNVSHFAAPVNAPSPVSDSDTCPECGCGTVDAFGERLCPACTQYYEAATAAEPDCPPCPECSYLGTFWFETEVCCPQCWDHTPELDGDA